MRTFPTPYSNCLLKEIILTFNSAVSKYVMSNCWAVISTWIVYLSSAVFQFIRTHTGAEVLDNRKEGLSQSSVGRESDHWEREPTPTSCCCFSVATFTIIAALDLWLINYHQHIAVLYCVGMSTFRFFVNEHFVFLLSLGKKIHFVLFLFLNSKKRKDSFI